MPGAPHRAGAAGAARVRRRRRDRRATTSASTSASSRPPLERDDRPRLANRTRRHRRAGPPPGARRGAQLQARHAGRPASDSTTSPSHRALDDALATADLLHVLLERAGGLGVTGPRRPAAPCPRWPGTPRRPSSGSPTGCPARPASTCSATARGEVLYVGKATNLRARVRSYFSTDDRRKIGALLRETAAHRPRRAPPPLAAAVLEVRLIHRFTPRYNRQAKDWSKYVYVKLTLDEAFPRLSVVQGRPGRRRPLPRPARPRTASPSGSSRPSRPRCPLRRCTQRVGARPRRSRPVHAGPARRGDLPVRRRHRRRRLPPHRRSRPCAGLTVEPELLLEPLADRLAELARAERFEEAADVRDRAEALAAALRRQRRFDVLRRAGRLVIEVPGQGGAELGRGRLDPGVGRASLRPPSPATTAPLPRPRPAPAARPRPRRRAGVRGGLARPQRPPRHPRALRGPARLRPSRGAVVRRHAAAEGPAGRARRVGATTTRAEPPTRGPRARRGDRAVA